MNVNEDKRFGCTCELCVPDMSVLDGFIPAAKPVKTAPIVEAVVSAPIRPAMREIFMPIPRLTTVAAN